ncbi:MAG: alkaline phosphatase family protein [Thermoplasmata archaeon]|nr:alkaline phosphatase family protein [Thermoplasmata archaeon]MCK5415393.1 alkaline phosphatase family protein [Thermoplasmata archaeon]
MECDTACVADGGGRRRLLIVGLDSGTFRVLKPFIDDGEVPTLGRLVEEGVHGVLLSSVPVVTPPG